MLLKGMGATTLVIDSIVDVPRTTHSGQATTGTNVIINMYYPQVSDKQSIKTTSRQLRQQINQGDRALGLA